ncbi:MAG: DUF2452 domain-containing protein [Bacteroidota bacterium]|nr:DUF2452 domain-containing protein [Bacteroidota bacterium]MDP3144932.1 DUF2452 domain-containing protein [Bacteroidota bacterium]
MINPIDKDKVAENPGLIAYPHNVGSIVIKPEDQGKLKSRALSAMREQTNRQLLQIHKQAELLAKQANELKERVEVSEKIYQAELSFEPFIGNTYHLYKINNTYKLMLIAPNEWGRSKRTYLEYVSSVKLLSDHTWEIEKQF